MQSSASSAPPQGEHAVESTRPQSPGDAIELTKSSVRDQALKLCGLGWSVLPPVENGDKRPLADVGLGIFDEKTGREKMTWAPYQVERATREHVEGWYSGEGRHGVGVVGGPVSGVEPGVSLACMDFDDPAAWGRFREAAELVGLAESVDRLAAGYLEGSPKGGRHLFAYVPGEIKTTKLAERPIPGEKTSRETIVEVKATGGFIILAPTFGPVHPSGKPYVVLAGSPETTAEASAEEWTELEALARSLDEMPPTEAIDGAIPKGKGSTARAGGELRPGDDFNARGEWAEALPPGWRNVGQVGPVVYMARPGKDRGWSATIHLEYGTFYVFTTSTEFEPRRSYTKMGALAYWKYGGNFEETARQLRAQGFGGTSPRRKTAQPIEAAPEVVADLKHRAIEAATADLGAFYENRPMMAELAALRATNSGAFAALKFELKKVGGFGPADFGRAVRESESRAEDESSTTGPVVSPYFEEGTGFAATIEDRVTPLTDFTAKIVEETSRDDGSGEAKRRYRIECTLRNGEVFACEVPAEKYGSMGWVAEHLGAKAVIHAGRGVQDHARTAIQLASEPVDRVVFIHTGWRLIGGTWHYLSAGGAIGPDGINPVVSVDLSDKLPEYRLPAPPEGRALYAAVRACLRILDLGQDGRKGSKSLAAILMSMPWRAAIEASTCAVQLRGMTGCQKSSTVALAQQHFGAGMNGNSLPANWDSTVNAIGELQFLAKDTLLVVDDFVPSGTPINAAQQHAKVEQIFRGAGNLQGRKRMNADGSLRPAKPPRGMLCSTGEDRIARTSANARSLPVSFVSPAPERGIEGTVDKAVLTSCQRDADSGVYASAMAGFVRHLAGRYEPAREQLRERVAELRTLAILPGQHDRTPANVAELAAGFDAFADFAVEVGAIDQAEAERHRARVWVGLMESAEDARADMASQGTPVDRFFQLLAASLASTKAYLGTVEDSRWPIGMETHCGWRPADEFRGGLAGSEDSRGRYQPSGGAPMVGWYDARNGLIYLEPDESHRVVAAMAQAQGESLPSPVTMRKLLADAGKLAERDSRNAAEGKGRLTARKTIQRARREVLVIRVADLWPGETEAAEEAAESMTIAFEEDAA